VTGSSPLGAIHSHLKVVIVIYELYIPRWDAVKDLDMRYSDEHSRQTRRAIMDAAGRAFREQGRAGAGVDAVAAGAGVTSGALYRQFKSKEDLFAQVTQEGIGRLVNGLCAIRRDNGAQWLEALVRFYVGDAHVSSAGSGCLLPTLAVDVARADKQTKSAFRDGLALAVETMRSSGNEPGLSTEEALLFLAKLLGGVVLARATGDPSTRKALERAMLADLPKQASDNQTAGSRRRKRERRP